MLIGFRGIMGFIGFRVLVKEQGNHKGSFKGSIRLPIRYNELSLCYHNKGTLLLKIAPNYDNFH